MEKNVKEAQTQRDYFFPTNLIFRVIFRMWSTIIDHSDGHLSEKWLPGNSWFANGILEIICTAHYFAIVFFLPLFCLFCSFSSFCVCKRFKTTPIVQKKYFFKGVACLSFLFFLRFLFWRVSNHRNLRRVVCGVPNLEVCKVWNYASQTIAVGHSLGVWGRISVLLQALLRFF